MRNVLRDFVRPSVLSLSVLCFPLSAMANSNQALDVANLQNITPQSVADCIAKAVNYERANINPQDNSCATQILILETGREAITLLGIDAADFDEAAAETAKKAVDFKSETQARSCLGHRASGVISCSVREDNDTSSLGASRPAIFSYTNIKGKKDSFAIKAAFKAQFDAKQNFKGLFRSENTRFNEAFWTLKTQWHKNNQQEEPQDNLNISGGLDLNFSNIGEVFRDGFEGSFWSIQPSANIGYNRKAIYGDAEDQQCIDDETLKACGTQHVETLRLTGQIAPYLDAFENTPKRGELYYSFAPSFGVFFDDALNGGLEQLSGEPINGSVAGGYAKAVLAISPGIHDNKFELSGNLHIIEAWDRSTGRMSDFKKTSRLASVSLNYALGESYVGDKRENTWIPSIGVTWSKGSDTLNGKDSEESTVVAFKLKY